MCNTYEASPPASLRGAAFGRLWAGATAQGLTAWAMPFILGFAVVDRTVTSTGLGVVLATRTAGFLAAVPVAGVLADRYSRRVVILVAGLAAAGATPLVAAGLGRSTGLMAVAALVVGAGQGACRPAFQALTAEVVDPSLRQEANAAITLAVNGTSLVTPGLVSLLVGVVSVRSLVVGTALLWLVVALAPPRGRHGAGAEGGEPGDPAGDPAGGPTGFVAELTEGLRESRRHAWYLASLSALTAVIATGYSVTGVALPLVSRDRYGSEAVLAGATTAITAGAIVGSLLVARRRPPAPGWVALAGLGLYGLAPLGLLLPVGPAVVFAAYFLTGLGLVVFDVLWFTAEQHEIAPSLLARVSSLSFLLAYGLAPVGLALIAPAIDAFGIEAVLGACAATCFLAPAAAALAPGSRTFARPRDDVEAAGAAQPASTTGFS